MRIVLLLLLLTQAGWAKPKAAKPKYRGTLRFFYYIDGDAPVDPERAKQEAEKWARVRNYRLLSEWLKQPTNLPECREREVRCDLNGDGRPEVFLVFGTGYRVEHYSLFSQQRSGAWRYLGVASLQEPPVRLARAHRGWHDFSVDVEGPRFSLVRHYYRWDRGAQEYEESYQVTIRPMDSSEP